MEFKRASDFDYPGILELQYNNLRGNLSDSEQVDGFLSAEFTQEQFRSMNEESAIVVSIDNDIIHGYICTSSVEFNRSFALPNAMINLFKDIIYQGKLLDNYRSLIVGPWCISYSSRGKGGFVKMWEHLQDILPNEVELLVTFVSVVNLRSLYAAKKVGMEEITKFKFQQNEFWVLAKLVK